MPSINSLIDPEVRAWVTGETYTPRKQNLDDANLKRGVVELNSAIADVEKHYADSDAPNYKPQGKAWYDTGNSVLKLYQTTNGTPVALLDSQKAYVQSLSTGGSGTIKLGGTIDVDTTTQTNRQIISSIPANTMSADGNILNGLVFGISSAANSCNWEFGGAVVGAFNPGAATDFISKVFIVRTGASSQKFGMIAKTASDGIGGTTLCDTGTLAISMSASTTLEGGVGSAGTSEFQIVKLKN